MKKEQAPSSSSKAAPASVSDMEVFYEALQEKLIRHRPKQREITMLDMLLIYALAISPVSGPPASESFTKVAQ